MMSRLLLCSLLWALVLAQAPAPYNLQTSYLANPIGIDVASPRLSWSLMHPAKAQFQTAYRVQVSQILQGASTLIWDTQMIKSSYRHVNYGTIGSSKPLLSTSVYTWQVQWWDRNGNESAWSEPATFGTGYFLSQEWTSEWIGGNGNILRKQFETSSSTNTTDARLFISGIGYYEVYINGQRVGDAHLDVGWTDYSQRVLYNAYDVASLLMNGNNTIGVMQGHGWYASTEAMEPDGPRSVRLQLAIDGITVVESDKTWTIAQGPIVFDGIYYGETYDARMEQEGWAENEFEESSVWTNVALLEEPGGIMSYQNFPPVREKVIMLPKRITQPLPGTYVVDFEQNFSGWCRINMTGPSGANITLRHAEVLDHNNSGLIYTANLRQANSTDIYIFKGEEGGETYEPRFTYHGFRYVQITSSDSSIVPTFENIIAFHSYSDVDSSGSISFAASSNILNQIQHNIQWGQTSNLMSVPTDCDQRNERKGWMGDAQLSAEEALHNFYMPSFYTNFLRLIRDEQDGNGTLTDTTPWTFGARPADPAWGAAYPSILYWLWKYYDDVEIVGEHYTAIKLYIGGFLTTQHEQTGLANYYYNYGDWVPPQFVDMCSSHLTSSFSYLAGMQQMIEMAQAVGQYDDAAYFSQKLNNLTYEFNQVFFNSTLGIYDTGLQTAMVLPIALGLVPPQVLDRVVINLLNDIVSTYNTRLTTGIIGTKYLMLALHQIGRDDIALQLAESFDYPSWGFMVVNPTEPATTLWELWESPEGDPGMDSRNHIMFGSVGDWFYKALAGIDQVVGDTGFQMFNIAPAVVGDLRAVNASFLTGSGNISVSWQKTGGDVLCASAPEFHQIELDCSSIGSDGVIEEITFASFGKPRGTCGAYGEHSTCKSATAHGTVQRSCLGKSRCSLLAHEDVLGTTGCDEGTFKQIHIQARCSRAAEPGLSLQASIPVGSTANVVLPAVGLVDVEVTVDGTTIWANNKYVSGADGISNGVLSQTGLIFQTGSGDYSFQLSGNLPSSNCFNTTEGFNLSLSCPAGQVITGIPFASFGSPYGECGSLFYGDCNAGSSYYVIEKLCMLKNSCDFVASTDTFGDPCFGYPKNIAVQVQCGNI